MNDVLFDFLYFWSTYFSIAFILYRLIYIIWIHVSDYDFDDYFSHEIDLSENIFFNFFSLVLSLLVSLLILSYMHMEGNYIEPIYTYTEIGTIDTVEFNNNSFIINDEIEINKNVNIHFIKDKTYIESISGYNDFGFMYNKINLCLDINDKKVFEILSVLLE